MNIRLGLFIMLVSIFPVFANAQADTLIKKLDSLGIKSDSLNNGRNNNTSEESYNKVTKLTPNAYFTLLGSNMKQQATLPFHTKRKDLTRLGSFALLTAGVALCDKPVNRFAINLHDNNTAVASVSKYITNFGGIYEIYTFAGLVSYGLIFKNQKIKTTTYLATQAYITGGVVQIALKFLSARQRPNYIDPATSKSKPLFHGPFFHFTKEAHDRKSYQSFPSGHTTAAFAAATVFAMEYRNKPLIPAIAYSAATLIGLSRLTENKHWPSDVFVGAALGYLSGKQIVNNYHRYAELKDPLRKKNTLSFNLNYSNQQLMPGFIYRFN